MLVVIAYWGTMTNDDIDDWVPKYILSLAYTHDTQPGKKGRK